MDIRALIYSSLAQAIAIDRSSCMLSSLGTGFKGLHDRRPFLIVRVCRVNHLGNEDDTFDLCLGMKMLHAYLSQGGPRTVNAGLIETLPHKAGHSDHPSQLGSN